MAFFWDSNDDRKICKHLQNVIEKKKMFDGSIQKKTIDNGV